MPKRRVRKRNARKRPSTKAKRAAAARKGWRTRNGTSIAKRRKAAAPKRRRNAAKGRRRKGARRGARLAYDALPPKRRRRRKAAAPRRRRRQNRMHNPGAATKYMGALRGAAQIAAVLLPVRALINVVGNFKVKDKDGNEVPLHQRIGPVADVGMSALALWAVPRFLLKGGTMGKYRQVGTIALQANLVLSAVNLLVFYARRDWKADSPAIAAGADDYPTWTDYLMPIEPTPMAAAGYFPLGAMDYAEPWATTPYGTLASPPPATAYDAGLGQYVAVS